MTADFTVRQKTFFIYFVSFSSENPNFFIDRNYRMTTSIIFQITNKFPLQARRIQTKNFRSRWHSGFAWILSAAEIVEVIINMDTGEIVKTVNHFLLGHDKKNKFHASTVTYLFIR